MIKEKRIKDRWKELPYLYKAQLIAYFVAGVCGAISYPVTTKEIYGNVATNTLASRLVLSSVIGLALSALWLNIQEKLYSLFVWFVGGECLLYFGLISYVIISKNYDSYLIISTIIGGTIGHIVTGAEGKLHQKITDNEQYRTDYGFFIEIISSLGVLIGSAIAASFNINPSIAFAFFFVSLTGFEITDIFIYNKIKRREN